METEGIHSKKYYLEGRKLPSVDVAPANINSIKESNRSTSQEKESNKREPMEKTGLEHNDLKPPYYD